MGTATSQGGLCKGKMAASAFNYILGIKFQISGLYEGPCLLFWQILGRSDTFELHMGRICQ